jgi:CheY-like chemotaxis protein
LHELDRLVRNTGRKRVLVVDDDDVARYLLSQYLSGCDVEIQEAGGGAAGLQLARELKPDLILLDLSMPDRNGFQVLEDLAIDPGTAEIPAVIVTAAVLSDSEKHRLGSASAILHKNELSTAALKQLIERCTKERVTADA